MNNDILLRQISELLAKRDFARAELLIKSKALNEKDPALYRAHYLMLSTPGSTLFDPAQARVTLEDMVNTFSDPWSHIELARSIITTTQDNEEISRAEDLLTRVREKELMAKYYLAEIYSKGINTDSNGPIFDFKEAMLLYKEIFTTGTGRIRNLSIERYCRIAINLGDMTKEKEANVFVMLQDLVEQQHQGASQLLGSFLSKKIAHLMTISIEQVKNDELATDQDYERAKEAIHASALLEKYFDL